MKKKIEIEIDLPDYIEEDFIKMLSMLDSKQLNLVKGTVIGMLLADNKISYDDIDKKLLIERKNKVNEIYDGYVFQVYAEYFGLIEQGYDVEKIVIHSLKDNKNYEITLPEKNWIMFQKYEKVIKDMKNFEFENFKQNNKKKCENCIYEPLCDRSLLC